VQLSELETHGFISKKIYAELPPKVEYSLTDLGRSLLPIITALGKWGDDNQEHLRRVIASSRAVANKSLASFEGASEAVFALKT
jgi:DNA-binding HxlR family transcriptional regulator